MTDLRIVVELSHEFGNGHYVKGGGGNTSFKNETTLWVKPSGTTLAGLSAASFVQMNRARIDALYTLAPPAEAAAREELIKNLMADAVEALEGAAGRPSVEAPLHNVFDARYVVHTHPPLVNGLTCGRDGAAACRRLFPDALWVEYIDPGYTLCMEVRERIGQYRAVHGVQPSLLVLQNHGIFVAADSEADIRASYARVMEVLAVEYARAGIELTLRIGEMGGIGEMPADPANEARIRATFGADAAFVASSGAFACVPGPITPDHLVYARAFPYARPVDSANAASYLAEHGQAPKVVVAGKRVYGIGRSQKGADLALELAQDGALVMQLSAAFGGINYMTDRQREFIENWEVESYRASQMA